MKKLLVISSLFLFCGCANSYDDTMCLQTVEQAYPNARVIPLPGESYRFIIVDSIGTVLYVKTMGISSSKITSVNVLYKK